MGPVTIPTAGRICIDTVITIYSVERNAEYAARLDPLWVALAAGTVDVLTSESTILECLVGPLRDNDAFGVAAFERTFAQSGLRMLPIGTDVLRRAADLRAKHPSLRTPDAIQLATADVDGADYFLTNDHKLRGKGARPVLVLSDTSSRHRDLLHCP